MKIRLVLVFLLLVGIGINHASAAVNPLKAFEKSAAKGKFVHVVYIWLKPDLDRRDVREFEKGMRELKKIKSVKDIEIGKPAGTKRDVVDNTYSYMLILYFNDAVGHDLYQIDAIHTDFVEKHKSKWTRIQVYDALVE